MSAPAQEGPAAPAEEKKKGLSKYVQRMKTVLKRSDGSKRLSFASRPAAGSSAPKASAATPAPAPVETATPAAPTTTPGGPQPIKVLRSDINAERARKLGDRFKITIESHEWTTVHGNEEAWRVEKPVRMRIHRTCHKCGTTFGGNKVCSSCQHTRCTKCPRYPTKKSKDKGKAAEVSAGTGVIEVDNYWGLQEKFVLTMPSHRAGAQPLVRKKPMQRVRRTCHDCSTLFPPGSKICSNCSHVRCTDCPRDPPKKKKYPHGYPGDVHSATFNTFACHRCDKIFPPVEEGAPPPECTRCKHVKCDSCKLARPRKVEPEPDPELLASVEAKLAALSLKPPTASS